MPSTQSRPSSGSRPGTPPTSKPVQCYAFGEPVSGPFGPDPKWDRITHQGTTGYVASTRHQSRRAQRRYFDVLTVPLDEIRAKFGRACYHAKEWNRVLDSWLEENPYGVRGKPESTGWFIVELAVSKEPPPPGPYLCGPDLQPQSHA